MLPVQCSDPQASALTTATDFRDRALTCAERGRKPHHAIYAHAHPFMERGTDDLEAINSFACAHNHSDLTLPQNAELDVYSFS